MNCSCRCSEDVCPSWFCETAFSPWSFRPYGNYNSHGIISMTNFATLSKVSTRLWLKKRPVWCGDFESYHWFILGRRRNNIYLCNLISSTPESRKDRIRSSVFIRNQTVYYKPRCRNECFLIVIPQIFVFSLLYLKEKSYFCRKFTNI